MDTNSRLRTATAAVTGARHLRAFRNGQDAAAAWVGPAGEGGPCGAIVVCDGCGSGASSEVGARLGARLVIAALARRLGAGARPSDPALWDGVRADVGAALAALVDAMALAEDAAATREQLVHDHLLFTVVAAAVAGGEVAVWSIGDGAYALDDRVRVLGPFADNQPPYVAYDLLGAPPEAHLETAALAAGTVIVATDGVAELEPDGLGELRLRADRYLRHGDALRRELAVRARASEQIDWEARRVVRTPAALQDDGAVAVLRWSVPS